MSDSVDTTSDNLSSLGDRLSAELQAVERQIASLPKKCKHHVFVKCSDGVGLKLLSDEWRLFLVRKGVESKWVDPATGLECAPPRLFFGISGGIGQPVQRDEHYEKWTPLADVSLEWKAWGLKHVEQLVREMTAVYVKRTRLVKEALSEAESVSAFLADFVQINEQSEGE